MIVDLTENGMLVHKLVFDNGNLMIGFLVREDYRKRSREEGFEEYMKNCREQVDCLFVVAALEDCIEVCRHIRILLDNPGLMNLDADDICLVAKQGKCCSAVTGTCSLEENLEDAMAELAKNTYVEEGRKRSCVLVSISGDVEFLECSMAADRVCQTLDEDANVIFGLQCMPEEGKKNILLLIAEE